MSPCAWNMVVNCGVKYDTLRFVAQHSSKNHLRVANNQLTLAALQKDDNSCELREVEL